MFRRKIKRKYQKTISLIVGVCFLFFPQTIYSLPEDPQTVSGNVNYDYSNPDYNLIVNSSGNSIINWDSFNVAGNERVYYNQPGFTSLNRITGGNPSEILGYLGSNGTIFLINPNGIFFGANSVVDVAGLMASTLDISNEDFLAGRYTFYGQGGSVVNQGYISAPGGFIALLGSSVENSGVIEANLGSVVLAAGEAMTLNLDPQGLISVVIDQAVTQNLEQKQDAVKNTGTIRADGGKVILTAKVLDGIFDKAVNNEGLIEASSLANRRGEVYLLAEGGENTLASNTGTIDVSATEIGADGGFVELSAPLLNIAGNIDVSSIDGNSGELFLDPFNFVIDDIQASFFEGFNGSITISAGNDVTFLISDNQLNLRFLNTASETFKIEAGRNIILNNDSVVTRGGNVAFFADAPVIGVWGNPHDGIGDILLGTGAGLTSNGGSITLDAVNLKLSAAINAGTGAVVITTIGGILDQHSGRDITAGKLTVDALLFGSLGDFIDTRINFLDINTTNDIFINNDNSGAAVLTITNAASSAGRIRVDTNNDLIVGSLSAATEIRLSSTNRAILDDGDNTNFISAATLILSARRGIGSGNALETQVSNLQATNSLLGDINISNTGSLYAQSVTNQGGNIGLTSSGDLTVGLLQAIGNDISLTSGGAILDDDINGSTDIIADNLTLSAATGIGSANALETQISSLNALNTNSGNINISNTGSLYAQSVVNQAGDVILTTSSDLTVGNIQAWGSADVYLTSTNGSILDDTDEINFIQADSISLVALGDIGVVGGDIDTDANTISANAGGDINIEEINGALFDNLIAGGAINLLAHSSSTLGTITGNNFVDIRTTSGDLTISGSVTSNTSGIGLTVDDGSIFATGTGLHMTANGDSFINAPLGRITPFGSALNVNIGGDLLLNIANIGSSPTGQIYGDLVGTVNGSLILLNTNFPSPLTPPGFVYFNGIQIWPLVSGTASVANLQLAQATIRYFQNGYAEYLGNVRIVSFDSATPNFYFYHPLTPTDFSAFDSISLDIGAYEFIDGNLNLKNKKMLPYYE